METNKKWPLCVFVGGRGPLVHVLVSHAALGFLKDKVMLK